MTDLVPTSATVVPAQRRPRPSWRDPRLAVGAAIVAGCVLLGARILAAADESDQVWVARQNLPAGVSLGSADLELRRVRFLGGNADRYLLLGSQQPDGLVLVRPVGAGELLPRAAVATGRRQAAVQLPLAVAAADVPGTLGLGSSVDVWAVPAAGDLSHSQSRARLLVSGATVIAAPRSEDAFAPQGVRQVLVSVGPRTDLSDVLGALGGSRLLLTVTAGR